jgi:hypothetical protein
MREAMGMGMRQWGQDKDKDGGWREAVTQANFNP